MTDDSSTPRLLVVDDEPDVITFVDRFSRQLGFDVSSCRNGQEALDRLSSLKPHAVVVDIGMPDVDGFDVLRGIHSAYPGCDVILMTGNPSVETAIEAIKLGALDYLGKPLELERLHSVLTTVLESLRRRERLLRQDAEIAQKFEFYGMVGRSAVMQQLFDNVRRLAPHVHTVLVTGETGTGKELVARALHALSPRSTRRFVTLNCSAVVDTLFESELFGHVRGAFTGATEAKPGLFEHANQGTIFLDEVGELPLSLQPKLLRAVELGEVRRVGSLEGRQVDVSVIGATNRDLSVEAEAGRFRSDLYYRLGIIELHLVPLRDRREDIPYLTARFVRDFAGRLGRSITGVSAAAERLLQEAPWRGNIRELRNVLERACILSSTELLSERDITESLSSANRRPARPAGPAPAPGAALPEDPMLLSTAHKAQIERAIKQARGNKSEAARLLGVSRRSLYRWIERLNIQ
jgi:two-component system, NtrC family, response regulator HydG